MNAGSPLGAGQRVQNERGVLSRPRHPSEVGFTRGEFVVVIATITILVALVLLSFPRSERKRDWMACQDNVRHLAKSWLMYAADHQDTLVPNQWATAGLANPTGTRGSWILGNPERDTSDENLRKGALFPYVLSSSSYRCPSDKTTLLIDGQNVHRRYNYGLSVYMNGGMPDLHVSEYDFDFHQRRGVRRLTEIRHPKQALTFIDKSERACVKGIFDYPAAPSRVWSSTIGDRDGSWGCSLSFADGHAERWRWRVPKEYRMPTRPAYCAADLKDLRKLQETIP